MIYRVHLDNLVPVVSEKSGKYHSVDGSLTFPDISFMVETIRFPGFVGSQVVEVTGPIRSQVIRRIVQVCPVVWWSGRWPSLLPAKLPQS